MFTTSIDSALPLTEIQTWDPSTPGLIGTAPWQTYSLEDYIAAGGYQLTFGEMPDTDTLLDELESLPTARALRGRGGAAFSTLRKLRSVADACHAGGRRAAVIANGAEGEPLSYKDRYLLRYRTHLVLDGALVAAGATGADTIHLYVADTAAHAAVAEAIAQLDSRRSGGPAIVAVAAQDTYVAGEETAVVRAVATGIARPQDKPPRPFQSGIDGAPTLVSNVETLAWLALILRRGTIKTADRFLSTVAGEHMPAHLYELPVGLPLQELIRRLPSGDEAPGRNILIGGFFGGIIPADSNLLLDYPSVRAMDSSLGCGSLYFLSPATCPIRVAADVVTYYATHNARQCLTCIYSTRTIAEALAGLGELDNDPSVIDRFKKWSTSLRGTGACAVPDGVATMLRTLLRHYPDVLAKHIDEGCSDCNKAPKQDRWASLTLQPNHHPSLITSMTEPHTTTQTTGA
ncbi:respiratory-chain NADH dehydrogenase domain-containing protein (plasmid) [Rhodococcus opacus]|uniref:Respiratory-chain NADH dehydrogenase domain-containing protein n=1 Tax=Rhodococcus opacus TaxID=37919 RepID=A0A1B1KH76_RHOOP|nr:NADH-ubiquinone oxidoreductase-F iron-sulfur binding region domain-containing protein [Rhodococcus opacus]ANS31949.1 respiratory-chain NADH dehydrogenase domain-containing protein [Rhodococcus opacus]